MGNWNRTEYKEGDLFKKSPKVIFKKEIEPRRKPCGQIERWAVFKCLWGLSECEKEFTARIHSIRSGVTKSCGCFCKHAISSIRFVKYENGHIFKKSPNLIFIEEQPSRTDLNSGNIIRRATFKCMWGLPDCKGVFETGVAQARNGGTKSCGCVNDYGRKNRRVIDLTGQTFSFLYVIKRVEPNERGSRFLTRCLFIKNGVVCNKETEKHGQDLITGDTKTCGGHRSIEQNKIFIKIVKPIAENSINEWRIKELKLSVDIVDFETRTAIEYDGHQHSEVWHHDKGDLTKLKRRKRNDRKKNKWLKKMEFCIIRIPERKYIKNPEKYHHLIENTLKTRQTLVRSGVLIFKTKLPNEGT